MKKIFFFVFILFCFKLFATEQIKDSLIYNGKGYLIENQYLFEEILNKYVTENGFYDDNYTSSNLWRGYRAVFEISNNQLRLKNLQIKKDTTDAEGFYIQYFENVDSEKIKKEINSQHFNGVLILADGYLVDYSFIYEEYYSNYRVAEFKKSLLTKELYFKYEELEDFKNSQFEEFKNTKFYRKDFKECSKRRKESIESYAKQNLPEMVEHEKNFDCSNFIKSFLFENPLYKIIL